MNQFLYKDKGKNIYNKKEIPVAVLDMEVDNEQYLLHNITNLKQYMELKPSEKQVKKKTLKSNKKEPVVKASYQSYKKEDKEKFFYWVYEKQFNVCAACKMVNIPPSTGQNWFKKGVESLMNNEDLSQRKSGSSLNSSSAGRPPKLCEEYKDFVVGIVDEKPDIVLEKMIEKLNGQFIGLKIKKTALHDFLTKKFQLTLKRAYFYSIQQNSIENIEERHKWVTR
ncbi:Homeodomain-like DNA binding domain-containing transcription factor [Phycomyces blakesleeanus]|uniref:Homeodomain-like DNA binding domain-containing transcription factor n=1 Tax=Phycomyces blakesleeanus TaxID=4837 RepID=A0ABR3BFM9_PHYBL